MASPHQLNGPEFEQIPGVGDGQGSLVCCSPWVAKSRTRLNNNTTENPGGEAVSLLKEFNSSESKTEGGKSAPQNSLSKFTTEGRKLEGLQTLTSSPE